MSDNKTLISVQIACTGKSSQLVLSAQVESGSSIRHVIEASGILRHFPEVQLNNHLVGVFGRLLSLDYPVKAGDRVEIYRPLPMDPKQLRRQRAAELKENLKT